MKLVAGVDGCPDGWFAASADLISRELDFRVFATFSEFADAFTDALAIGVDIPIGLPTTYSRQADKEARKLMPGKGSSVFPAPHPDLLGMVDFNEASSRSKEVHGKGITRQTFAILPKIAEVNLYLEPEMQDRIFEVHPEVSFTALQNGLQIIVKKSRVAGFDARRKLMMEQSGFHPVPSRLQAKSLVPGRRVNPDDVLDAIVAAWTAGRVVQGLACRIPALPEIGFRGLKAEIVF